MIIMPNLILYSTDGCHLCEQVLAMLGVIGLTPQVIDIAFNDELFLRYGVTIPVLHCAGNELNWPFDDEQLKYWLEKNGITYHK